MIEAVVFDYGGVVGAGLGEALVAFERRQGYPRGSVHRLVFGDETWQPGDDAVRHDWHRLEIGAITLQEYLDGVVDRAPDVLGEPVDLDAFASMAATLPIGVYWPIVHCIRELRATDVRTGLLTNNVREFGDAWRDTIPVAELFDVVVDSSEVGLRKPDPQIYRLTCDRLGVAPSMAVFVDDNEHNVQGAAAVGMRALRFRDPFETVAALAELLAAPRPPSMR